MTDKQDFRDIGIAYDYDGVFLSLTDPENKENVARSAYLSDEVIVTMTALYYDGKLNSKKMCEDLYEEVNKTTDAVNSVSHCPVCNSEVSISYDKALGTWNAYCSKNAIDAEVSAASSQELQAVWQGFVSAFKSMNKKDNQKNTSKTNKVDEDESGR